MTNRRAEKLKRRTERFSNLLIRSSDVTPTIHATARTRKAADLTLATDDPQILIPCPLECFGLAIPSIKQGEPTQETTLSDFSDLSLSPSIVPAVLKLYSHNAPPSFATHVDWTHALLKKCHAEDIDQPRYKELRQEYKDYLYLSCYPKMLTRLKIGNEPDSNFLQILTSHEEDFDENAFDREDIMPEHQAILPTEYQAEFIKDFFESQAQGSGVDKDEITAKAELRSKAPIYDKMGRSFFHYMMSNIIQMAVYGIHDLDAKMKSWERGQETVETLQDAVQKAQVGMTNMYIYFLYFGRGRFGSPGHGSTCDGQDLLSLHLTWLSRITGVARRTDEPRDLKTASEKKEHDDDEDEKTVDEEESAKTEIDQVMSRSDRWDSGWAKGARKFLDIWSLHEYSFQAVCSASMKSRGPLRSRWIRESKVQCVGSAVRVVLEV